MASEPGPPTPPQTPAEGVPLVYVNWLRTTGTPADLSIDVGYQGGDVPPQPAARLVMTWEHARILRDSLSQAIKGFEDQEGETIRDLKKHLQIGPPRFGPGAQPAEQGGRDDD